MGDNALAVLKARASLAAFSHVEERIVNHA